MILEVRKLYIIKDILLWPCKLYVEIIRKIPNINFSNIMTVWAFNLGESMER